MDVGLSLLEKEFRKEYSSYRRLFDLLCDQEERVNLLMTVVTSLYLPCGRTTLLSVFHSRLFA